MKNRAGRKKSQGARFPCGKLKQEEAEIMSVALSQPHRRHWPVKLAPNGRDVIDHRRDQMAESEVGRMRLAKLITEGQYEAAVAYRKAHVLYMAALAMRDALARYSGGPARVVPDDEQKRRVAKFEAALACLDRRASPVVGRIVLRDQPVAAFEVTDIRRGLTHLARHYGIGEE